MKTRRPDRTAFARLRARVVVPKLPPARSLTIKRKAQPGGKKAPHQDPQPGGEEAQGLFEPYRLSPQQMAALERMPSKPTRKAEGRKSKKARLPPGPAPKFNWKSVVKKDLLRQKRRRQKLWTVPQILDYCTEKWDWQPDSKDVRELRKSIISPAISPANSPAER